MPATARGVTGGALIAVVMCGLLALFVAAAEGLRHALRDAAGTRWPAVWTAVMGGASLVSIISVVDPLTPLMTGLGLAGAALAAVAVLSLILVVNPSLAHWLTLEDGVVEWLQVSLDAAAVALIGRHLVRDNAEGERSPLDVLTVAALIGLIIGELDVDRWLFDTKVISTAFFFKAKYALPWRLLAALVVVGVPAAVGIYALRHVRTLWREGWSALGQPWGRVLAASA